MFYVIKPFYRSYTINFLTNPHNLASGRLTPASICLFKESKQAKKERKTSRTIALDSGNDRKVENLLQ